MPKPKDKVRGHYVKSESITFRIEKSVLEELRNEAEQKMESVNTLVNQIIKTYLQWYKPAKRAGLAHIPKELMASAINIFTDDQIIQMAEEFCNHRLIDIIHMLKTESNFTSFMNGLCFWLGTSGFNYRIDSNDNDNEVYIIQFDLGRKWSLYFKTMIQLMFEYYNINNAEIKITDNIVILKIKK